MLALVWFELGGLVVWLFWWLIGFGVLVVWVWVWLLGWTVVVVLCFGLLVWCECDVVDFVFCGFGVLGFWFCR